MPALPGVGSRDPGCTHNVAVRRKLILSAVAGVVVLAALAARLYVTNEAPVVPRVTDQDAAGRPFVVKLHAQWCPVCMTTKGVWDDIQSAYAGRVNLVVLDFTNEETTRASEAEANRLGLRALLDEWGGTTGYVLVLDATGATKHAIKGSRDPAVYRQAIDEVLTR